MLIFHDETGGFKLQKTCDFGDWKTSCKNQEFRSNRCIGFIMMPHDLS